VSDCATGTGLCNGFREAPLKSAYRNCCGSERMTAIENNGNNGLVVLRAYRKLPITIVSVTAEDAKHVLSAPAYVARSLLFVAADLPPIKAFEFGHFFGAMFPVPAAPGERVRGQILIRNFLQREESPASHLPSCAGIHRQIEELWHDPHALFAREYSAIGNVEARAVPDAVGGISGERSEQLIENFIFA